MADEELNRLLESYQTHPPSRERLMPLLRRYRQLKDHDEAHRLLIQAKNALGDQRWWQLELAATQIHQKNYAPALASLRHLHKTDPNNVHIRVQLSAGLRQTKKADEALLLWPESDKMELPIHARMEVARLLRITESYEAATELFSTIPEEHPAWTGAQIDAALCMEKAGRIEASIAALTKLLAGAIKPQQRLTALIRLADLHWRQRHIDEVAYLVRAVLDLKPDHLRAQILQVEVCIQRSQLDGALDLSRQLQAQWPDHANVQLLHGRTLNLSGQYEEALTHLRTFHEKNPDDIRFAKTLLQYASHIERWSDIITWYEQYDLGKFEHEGIDISCALAYWHQNKTKLADDLIQQTRARKQTPAGIFQLCRFYQQTYRPDQAEKALTSLLGTHLKRDDKKGAVIRLFDILLESGRRDAANELLDEHADLSDEKQLIVRKSRVLIASRKYEEAIRVLRAGLDRHAQDVTLALRLSSTYADIQSYEEAYEVLNQLPQERWSFEVLCARLNLAYYLDDGEAIKTTSSLLHAQHHDHPKYASILLEIYLRHHRHKSASDLVRKKGHQLREARSGWVQLARHYHSLGDLALMHQTLQEGLRAYPKDFQLSRMLAHCHKQMGQWNLSARLLEDLKTDKWLQERSILHDLAFHRMVNYDYQGALDQLELIATPHRNHLLLKALCQTILGQLEDSHRTLYAAAKDLITDRSSKTVVNPLQSRSGKINNALRSHPTAFKRWQDTFNVPHAEDRTRALAQLTADYPNYLGGYLWLMIQMRHTGQLDIDSRDEQHMSTIPKKIMQFWDSPRLPKDLRRNTSAWANQEGFAYTLFNSDTARAYVEKHYEEIHLNAFDQCRHPAEMSDYFRLAYLAREGGLYADIDDYVHAPLGAWFAGATFIGYQEHPGSIGNNLIACVPQHPFILSALDMATARLNSYANEPAWFKTGPLLLTASIAQHLSAHLLHGDHHAWVEGMRIHRQTDLSPYFWIHLPMPYKHTNRSWFKRTYHVEKRRGADPPRPSSSESPTS